MVVFFKYLGTQSILVKTEYIKSFIRLKVHFFTFFNLFNNNAIKQKHARTHTHTCSRK